MTICKHNIPNVFVCTRQIFDSGLWTMQYIWIFGWMWNGILQLSKNKSPVTKWRLTIWRMNNIDIDIFFNYCVDLLLLFIISNMTSLFTLGIHTLESILHNWRAIKSASTSQRIPPPLRLHIIWLHEMTNTWQILHSEHFTRAHYVHVCLSCVKAK